MLTLTLHTNDNGRAITVELGTGLLPNAMIRFGLTEWFAASLNDSAWLSISDESGDLQFIAKPFEGGLDDGFCCFELWDFRGDVALAYQGSFVVARGEATVRKLGEPELIAA